MDEKAREKGTVIRSLSNGEGKEILYTYIKFGPSHWEEGRDVVK